MGRESAVYTHISFNVLVFLFKQFKDSTEDLFFCNVINASLEKGRLVCVIPSLHDYSSYKLPQTSVSNDIRPSIFQLLKVYLLWDFRHCEREIKK